MEHAARGSEASRDEFARLYRPVVVSYLGARWRRTPLQSEVDDAAQEVFVDLMKSERRPRSRQPGSHDGAGGFRAFLYGVARNVALRHEEKRGTARACARRARWARRGQVPA